MGENEQSGLLRVVIVVGLVGVLLAFAIGVALTAKDNMYKNSNIAISNVNSGIDDANATANGGNMKK